MRRFASHPISDVWVSPFTPQRIVAVPLSATTGIPERTENHEDALSLAQATYDECSVAFTDLSDGQSEATMLLQIQRDNIRAWSRE
jgi:hypothetical protein